MKRLINDPTRADVTFLLKDKEVHAHRCMIMVRCKTLEEYIRTHSIESSELQRMKIGTLSKAHRLVQLREHNTAPFLHFLEYVYTDSLCAVSAITAPKGNSASAAQ